jgi:tRNA U34 2-thiouridine synthase MnmA/TrmU
MTTRAVVLLSGGLDSRLAVRALTEQGIEVEALHFRTMFTCCHDDAAQAARDLGVRLTVIGQEDDYLDLVKSPRYGYGKGANPCVDCRIYMFEGARRFMEQSSASFVASGEVLGQRPMSQKRRDLSIIMERSGLEDRLLRPLSAKRLPPTLPERTGLVDRARLYDFSGRGRGGLIRLARQFGFPDEQIPTPSSGCMLTERLFGAKVHDLVQIAPQSTRWDFELLKCGRHFRLDAQTKVVVGRNEADNTMLEYLFRLPEASEAALLVPHQFSGPEALVVGNVRSSAMDFAGGLILRYARESGDAPQVSLWHRGERSIRPIAPQAAADVAVTIATAEPPKRST